MRFLFGFLAVIAILIGVNRLYGKYEQHVMRNSFNATVSLASMGGSGTGVFISPTRIITACHVVDGSIGVSIKTFSKEVLFGKVIVCDKENDIAFIDLENGSSEYYANLSCTEKNVNFDRYFSIGHPLNVQYVMKHGYITSINEKTYSYQGLIFQGDSGSAVFDKHGNIVGIVQTTLIAMVPTQFGLPATVYMGNAEIFKSSKACEMYLDKL